MIEARRTLTVDNKTSRLDQPIIFYRGDGGIMLYLEVKNVKYRFGRTPSLDKFDSAFYRASAFVNFKVSGKKLKIPKKGMCQDGIVQIFISEQFLDEVNEVGTAEMQLVLEAWDGARITIPPFTIEIRKRVVDLEDEFEYYSNVVTHNHRVFKHVETVRKFGEISGTLQLSNQHAYQTATFTGDVTITAPTVDVDTPDEIYLYFTCTVDRLNISFTNIDWDVCGGLTQFQANTNYELILYPKDATHWLATYRIYQ